MELDEETTEASVFELAAGLAPVGMEQVAVQVPAAMVPAELVVPRTPSMRSFGMLVAADWEAGDVAPVAALL